MNVPKLIATIAPAIACTIYVIISRLIFSTAPPAMFDVAAVLLSACLGMFNPFLRHYGKTPGRIVFLRLATTLLWIPILGLLVFFVLAIGFKETI